MTREEKNKIYDLHVNLHRAIQELMSQTSNEKLEEVLGAYVTFMQMKDGDEVTISRPALQNMALFAGHSLSRFLYTKYKGK